MQDRGPGERSHRSRQSAPGRVGNRDQSALGDAGLDLATVSAPRWAWGVLALLVAMHVLDTIGRWLLLGVLSQPQARDELSLSETQLGWLSTVLLLGLAFASVPTGFLVDRVNRPRVLAIGFAVWSMATISTGLVRSFDQLQLARALVGVGGAAFTVVALTLLMDLFPRSVRRGYSRFFSSRSPWAHSWA